MITVKYRKTFFFAKKTSKIHILCGNFFSKLREKSHIVSKKFQWGWVPFYLPSTFASINSFDFSVRLKIFFEKTLDHTGLKNPLGPSSSQKAVILLKIKETLRSLHMTKSMCIAVQLRKFFFHNSQLHNKPLLEKSQNPREIRTCSLPIARHKC